MFRPGGDSFTGANPWRPPLPYFYNQTLVYLEGNLKVLDELPAIQESALEKAKQSATRAVPLERRSRHREGGQEETPFYPRGTPTLSPIASKPPFSEMVRREIPLVMTPVPLQHEKVGPQGLNKSFQDADHTGSRRFPQVYDGIRSSPLRNLTSPHTWKVYTGPFPCSHRATIETDQRSNHPNTTKHAPQTTTNLQPPPIPESPPIPKLQLATLAIRATPKQVLITHRRRPPPKPITPPVETKPLPSRPHYTSQEGTLVLAALQTYLLLSPSASSSSSPGTILAGLLAKWPTLRHVLPRENPVLARQVEGLDWSGVECEFAEGSFARRVGEGGVLLVGRPRMGMRMGGGFVFEGWEWEE